MKKRNIYVEVVDLPSILGYTEYKKELFFIQGYARRGKNLKKNKDGVPEAIPVWRAKRTKKSILFFNTQFYLNRRWVYTLTMLYVAKMDASFSILQAI
jgi:hypothetical protein